MKSSWSAYPVEVTKTPTKFKDSGRNSTNKLIVGVLSELALYDGRRAIHKSEFEEQADHLFFSNKLPTTPNSCPQSTIYLLN